MDRRKVPIVFGATMQEKITAVVCILHMLAVDPTMPRIGHEASSVDDSPRLLLEILVMQAARSDEPATEWFRGRQIYGCRSTPYMQVLSIAEPCRR